MAKGAGWMVLFKLVERGLGLVSTLVLARILLPADFGLVAMATAFAAILDVLSSFSFDLALIQRQDAERRHYDTAWTYNVIASAVVAVAIFATAEEVATFFREPAVAGVQRFLSLCFLIQGFQNIGTVAFQKELKLHKEFTLGVVKKLVQIVATIALAFWLRNYWALLWGMLVSRATGVLLSYAMHPYRPRPSLAATGELMRFSKWMIASNIVIFANSRGMDFVVGRIAGAGALGLYSVAYELSNLPTTELVFPISRAVYPGYASVAASRDKLRELFMQVLGLTVLITIPIGFAIAVHAKLFVYVLLGSRWLDAVPLVEVLAVYGVVRAVHGGTGSIYLALDRPHLVGVVNLLMAMITIPFAIGALIYSGLNSVPYAILCGGLIAASFNFATCSRMLRIDRRMYVRACSRPVGGVLVLLGFAGLMRAYGADAVLDAFWAVGEFARMLGALACYAVTVLLLWRLAGKPEGAESRLLLAIWSWRRPR
jgi:PST family polysaccharide transporter